MDESERERFARAVDRKKAEAKEASEHAPAPEEQDTAAAREQASLVDPAHTQDVRDTRAKSTRHKKTEPGSASQP